MPPMQMVGAKEDAERAICRDEGEERIVGFKDTPEATLSLIHPHIAGQTLGFKQIPGMGGAIFSFPNALSSVRSLTRFFFTLFP